MDADRIRKSVSELTPDDLRRFPVWEYTLDEEGAEDQDETTVRPCVDLATADISNGSSVVRATIQLADGTEYDGYIAAPEDGDYGAHTLQPVIVTDARQIGFWMNPFAPEAESINLLLERLAKVSLADVFPARYTSEVKAAGFEVRGDLTGMI